MTEYPTPRAPAPVVIHSIEVQPIVVRGQRVLTFAMIDKIHGRTEGTSRKRFNDNKARMTEGEDHFLVSPSEIRTTNPGAISDAVQSDLIVVTESGYLLLVKSFTDDLAWQVQKQLVKIYFRYQAEHVQTLTDYEKITPKQLQTLAQAVHNTFTGWVFSSEHAQHAYSALRVIFRLEHIADLPAADFDRALLVVAQIKDMNWQFLLWVTEARDTYVKEYAMAGTPWTPWLKREWKKQMKTALPARPDWLAIQQQLELGVTLQAEK